MKKDSVNYENFLEKIDLKLIEVHLILLLIVVYFKLL